MTFHFAWAGPAETTFGVEHQVEDEEVFAFTLEHTEGDFATLAIDIRNPRRQFLAEGADLWMWLSEDGTPLFFGRLVAVPEDLHAEIVRLNFVARPTGYDAAKRALADTLRVRPYWDPVWILDERMDDPDTVLEARTQLWHIDRVTHAVTVSDIISGEDGTLAIADHDYASLSVRYGAPPVRSVKVDAEISWDQIAEGSIDITAELLAAFAAAGSPAGVVSSYTGQGLEADWPEPGADLRGGWRVGEVTLTRADGVWKDARYKDARITAPTARVLPAGLRVDLTGAGALTGARRASEAFLTPPVTARFYAWEFRPPSRSTTRSRASGSSASPSSLPATSSASSPMPARTRRSSSRSRSRRVSETIDGAVPLGRSARGPRTSTPTAAGSRSTT